KPVPSQRLSIVLEPRVAASIIGLAGGTLSGDRMLKGRSPFAGRLGEVIASPRLTLIDDPTNPFSLAADSHDGEGLACRPNELIVDGELRQFLHNAYTARRAGVSSTGSAIRSYRSTPGVGCQALSVRPGSGTHDELVAGVELGLLVDSMSGFHSGVNAVSGDFSVGAEGIMIRNGQLAEPVREVTIASTLQRLLLGIEAVGADLEWLPSGTGSVTLVIGDVALSGT
ncbi:MAG TPA: metallopeptidase TldD-related protein, partial [Acidimicrobiales bacterium]